MVREIEVVQRKRVGAFAQGVPMRIFNAVREATGLRALATVGAPPKEFLAKVALAAVAYA